MKEPALILNVDDYQPGRYARTKLLSRAGFRVQEAASGEQALRLLETNPEPELIVLDVNLPDIHGFEVCRRIKTNPDTAHVIVMHLSASNIASSDKIRGLNSGADTYLTEPVDDEVLLATIRALLRARSAEEALRRSNQDLQQLANMLSHELREPLRAVTAYVQKLNRDLAGRLEPSEQQSMDFALSGARRVGTLLEEVMGYARTFYDIEQRTVVDAEKALSDVLAEQELFIAEAGATVERQSLPLVRGTETGLARVFSNLISNAIKYRSSEPPVIRISATVEGEFCTFAVEDNGMGIEPCFHKTVFEIFKRLHGQDISGTGVGLALCRRIIENFGGTIWVESAPGQGSTFYFTLPSV